ncbi:MAG TPA: helix-turn-helix transcriptional regulator [Ktedonobacterales bacterium]|nr:helix-turn-helix transcriptional regulator [Ktedonobacterales bacterium]
MERQREPWDARALLLLGALTVRSQHGYQINDFIERCRVTDLKKPTAYALLDRLVAAGHISVQTEQEGNRPIRKVYTLTASGQSLFDDLLRENLATPDTGTGSGDIGLMFLDYLPRAEAVAYLRRRLDQLDRALADTAVVPPHGGHLTVNVALEHQLALRRADRDWLAALVERFEAESADTTLTSPRPSSV